MKTPAMFSFIVVLATLALCDSSRILMMPSPVKSRQLQFSSIADELSRRGHLVYMYMGESVTLVDRLKNSSSVTFVTFRDDAELVKAFEDFQQWLVDTALEGGSTGALGLIAHVQHMAQTWCQSSLSDNARLDKLKTLGFDLVIVDEATVYLCSLLVPHRLGVPHVSLVDYPEPWLLHLPWLPSAVPFKRLGLPYSEEMTFWQRLTNLFLQVAWALMPLFPDPMDIIEKYQQYGPVSSVDELRKKSMLYLITSDYHLDYAVPMMPFMIPVPGLSNLPTRKLPTDFEKLLNDSADGAIIVSFGSHVASFPEATGRKMLAAFAAMKQTVFWRFRNTHHLEIPANVYIRDWLPQNDLLAHPKVKLFVTHAGNSGQHEALYHGVPMLAFPLSLDQPYNAMRMQHKGLGLTMDIKTFTTKELVTKLNLIISNLSFKTAIVKASRIFRARSQPPWEKAAFWIEHVIKYGANHLHSYSEVMPWYQFLMLDIAGFCILIVVVCAFVARKFTSWLWYTCCRREKVKVE